MNRIEEFWYCVGSQEELPLYKIKESSSDKLLIFLSKYKKMLQVNPQLSPEKIIKMLILDDPEAISDIRVLVGVSDKRLYLDLSFIFNRFQQQGLSFNGEDRKNLKKHSTSYFVNMLKSGKQKELAADVISQYFLSKSIDLILNTFKELSDDNIEKVYSYLIAPKETQQKEAKYRGHGAESAFAEVVKSCGVSFLPEHKDTDAMGTYDPNVNLEQMEIVPKDASNEVVHSFDLVILDEQKNIRILVQSLIHSSDPGQYGVNKSDETVQIRSLIDSYNEKNPQKPVYLWGLVDGVGFTENPKGTIEKMLGFFHEFVQINTLFKIGIGLNKVGLCSDLVGISFDRSYFEDEAISSFETNYLRPLGLVNVNEIQPNLRVIAAGRAQLLVKS